MYSLTIELLCFLADKLEVVSNNDKVEAKVVKPNSAASFW